MKLPKIDAVYLIFSKLSRREKAVFYAAAAVITLLLLEKLIISPISSNLRSLDEEISRQESQNKSDTRIVARKSRIHSDAETYGAFVSAPPSEEEATTMLLKEIEGLADASKVNLIDVKPAGVKTEEVAKKYMVTLTCEGKMEQITNFLYAIESSNKLLKVERYQISPKSKETTAAQVSMTVSQAVLP